jgi:hypothetical protein
MRFFRPTPPARFRRRAPYRVAAVLSCTALLAGSVSACSQAERLTTGMKVRYAVMKLGQQSSATVVASVDGSPRQARAFLARARGGEAQVSQLAAERLARGELTVSAGVGDEGEEIALKDMPESDAANVAAALDFGGDQVAAVKSVDDELYLKADLKYLVDEAKASERWQRRAEEVTGLADDLPSTLKATKDALRGGWVRVDPMAFDDFAEAAEELAVRQRATSKVPHVYEEQARRYREVRDAVTVGQALEGQPQRAFLASVQDLFRQHAEFEPRGEHAGAEHVRMTLPGKKAAKDVVAALRPLGAEIDPSRVPDRDVTADLTIRRGQLTAVDIDLGRLVGGPSDSRPRLPLHLEVSGGDAVAVTEPPGAEELLPQDLVAAMAYGALGRARF